MTEATRAPHKAAMRVLVVDDEANSRFMVERAIRKAGIDVASAATVRHAIDRLRAEAYDAVFCDLRAANDGGQLVQWLGSFSPSTHIVLVVPAEAAAVREAYLGAPGVHVVDKPVDTDALVRALEEFGPRRGFYGNSIEVELFDYVQMIALSGRDKLIEVTTPKGTGLIWFEHGDIVHCEYGDFQGETAFYKMLAVNRGTFKETLNRSAPKQTVVRSSTHLLMEAARQFDEGILGEVDMEAPSEAGSIRARTEEETSFEELNVGEIGEEERVREQPAANEPEPAPRPAPAASASSSSLKVPPSPPPAPRRSTRPVPGKPAASKPAASKPAGGKPAPPPTATQSGPHPVLQAVDASWDEVTGEVDVTPEPAAPVPAQPAAAPARARSEGVPAAVEGEDASTSTAAGHAVFDDPDMRNEMLQQFWQFEGINGVAIISSTGKVLAEDMRSNSSLVTLAGFYMRGAARIARTLGYNVFDGVVARSTLGQQMVMVSMGAASAVLSVEPEADPEAVRDQVMGVE